jgi:hypothetical protein
MAFLYERGPEEARGLASRTVGDPFVGATAASLVIAEVLRRLNGGPSLEVLDMTLRDPTSRAAIQGSVVQDRLNPGFTSRTENVSKASESS